MRERQKSPLGSSSPQAYASSSPQAYTSGGHAPVRGASFLSSSYAMFASVLVSVLFTLGYAGDSAAESVSAPRTQEILNGEIDDADRYPWVVKLRAPGGVCTGILLEDRYVLTAAHCVCPAQLTDDGGQRREAGHCASTAFVSTWQSGSVGSTQEASVFVHPDFVTEVSAEGAVLHVQADIALVELKTCLLRDVPTASLPIGDVLEVNDEVNIAGYGPLVCAGQSRSERFLGRARVDSIGDGFVNVRPISNLGQGAASGDSGGPVFDDDGTVYGVVSYGSCTSTVSYVDVRSQLPWVMGVLNRAAYCVGAEPEDLPEAWSCGGGDHADGFFCDCDCGALDPDCQAGLPTRGCPSGQTCNSSGTCATAQLAGWFCPAQFAGDGVSCDCDCGANDSDCEEGDTASCPGSLSCSDEGVCRGASGDPPASWTCSDAAYADGNVCDCGCGFPDPDCLAPDTISNDCGGPTVCSATGDRCQIDLRECGGVAALTHDQREVTLNTCNHVATFGCNAGTNSSRDLVVSLEGFEDEPLRVVASSSDISPVLYPIGSPCGDASLVCATISSGGSEVTLDFEQGNLAHVVVDSSSGCGLVSLELVFPDHPGGVHPFPCDASPEVCDGRDNDCNGITDDESEGSLCDEREGLELLGCGGTGGCVYACPLGQTALAGDPLLGCEAELPAGNGDDELCDGIDNNENEQIDENGVFGCEDQNNAVATACKGVDGCTYRCLSGFRDADNDMTNGCETVGSSEKRGCSSSGAPPGSPVAWLAAMLLVAMYRRTSRTACSTPEM